MATSNYKLGPLVMELVHWRIRGLFDPPLRDGVGDRTTWTLRSRLFGPVGLDAGLLTRLQTQIQVREQLNHDNG